MAGKSKQTIHDDSISNDSGKFTKCYENLYGEDYGIEEDYYIGIGPWPGEAEPSEVISENSLKVLNFFESGLIISLFEDALEELDILKYVIGSAVVPWKYEYNTIEERFEKRASYGRLFPEVDSVPAMTNSLMLQRDRTFIEETIRRTVKTLMEEGTFDPLLYGARQLLQQHKDENDLLEELQKNTAYLSDIKERVRKKNQMEDDEEKERDGLLYTLKDEIDDTTLKCTVEENFVNKWEITRNKQNRWRLRNAENYYRDNIEKFKIRTSLENLVTNEMQTYVKNAQMILEEDLEAWMTRYDSELERRENKIIQLKYEKDQQEEEMKRLTQLLEDRIIEMKEWVAFRDFRKKLTSASVIIQSWWRGLMVRKKIGPYKPKKEKTEKKK